MQFQRFYALDALRGVAMLWMTVFHFCFDLSNAGYIQQNFYTDPVWTWQRTCILGLFLLCAGAGQAIAHHREQTWQRFSQRWLQIAGCAFLVTAGSAIMFPQSYIYFGVLHGMAVMLIIARLTASWGRWLWLAGTLAIAMKFVAAYAIDTGAIGTFLNQTPYNVMGLISVKPITEDYVPIVPWLGVMWWGMAGMQWWLLRAVGTKGSQIAAKKMQWHAPAPPVLRPLVVLGQWALSYYMLHQLVLLGGLWVWGTLR